MKLFISFLMLILFIVKASYAKGVSAGTIITNIATLSFEIDSTKRKIVSNQTKDVVAQLLDVSVNAMDARGTFVSTNEKDKVLTFKVTNSGNGSDRYKLSIVNDLKSDFKIENQRIYKDLNNDKNFNNSDTPVSTINLSEDESKTIFVVSDIKDIRPNQSGKNIIYLKARSLIGGSGERGKIYEAKGINGVDAIDSANGGMNRGESAYIYNVEKGVILSKSVQVKNKYGTNEAICGATITYDINVSTVKDIKIESVEVIDFIPKHTDYKKCTLLVNDKKITDAIDLDGGYFDKEENKIVVIFDEIKYPETKNIKFDVKLR